MGSYNGRRRNKSSMLLKPGEKEKFLVESESSAEVFNSSNIVRLDGEP